MVKINIDANCENAPKKTFLKEFNIAFAKFDLDYIMENVSDTATWEMVGGRTVQGKAAIQAKLSEMASRPMETFTLEKIITHGTDAAASGRFKMQGKEYAFCDVYKFAGFKGTVLKGIVSFVIPLD